MSESSLHEARELVSELWTISDSGDHDVLIKNSFIRLLDVFIKGPHEIWDRVCILDGHDPLASFIVWRMQRYGE
jgi:hypothetical protein